MPKIKDITGKIFGRLTVLGLSPNKPAPGVGSVWDCACSCGAITTVPRKNIVSGNTSSCGCLGVQSRIKHGLHASRSYSSWENMIQRCTNPNAKAFHNYGGRGIDVHGPWKSSFKVFRYDMGDPPTDKHTLDRVDNNRGYSPDNCRWATRKEQANNRRNNVSIVYKGVARSFAGWEEKTGISSKILRERIRVGWSTERALTTPVNKR